MEVVSDREMVAALGINVPLVSMLVFGLGTWMAGIAGVAAALHNDGPAAVALGVDGDHRPAVLEQGGRGVAEVLAGLAIDDDLALLLTRKIHQRYVVPARRRRRRLQR